MVTRSPADPVPCEARSRWDHVVKKARCPADPVPGEARSRWDYVVKKARLDRQTSPNHAPPAPPPQPVSDDSQLSDVPSVDG